MKYRSTQGCLISVIAVLLAGCSFDATSESPNELLGSATQAVTTLTLSGKVKTASGVGIPGVTVTLAGSGQGTRITDSTGNYSFSGLAAGSYSLRPTQNACSLTPDVVNLNNLTSSKTQNFVGSGSGCGVAGRAMILVDTRLYALLQNEIDQYRTAASARRGFGIEVRTVSGIDDYTPQAVKSYVAQAKSANPSLEGVLYIGNIKLPSFFKPRPDITGTRLYPAYLEDLDGVFTKNQAPGSIAPTCDGTNDQTCVIGDPMTVPQHDFDWIAKGPNPNPELWAAFLPVGASGTNTYSDFANQLRPYFAKVMSFYNHLLAPNGRYYTVGNGISYPFSASWDAFGGANIDFYGKPGPNGETGDACLVNGQNLCYARWPTEGFATAAAFEDYYATFPWVAENWQTADVFIPHMNAALYSVVEVSTHAMEMWSLIDSSQARALTKAGLLVTLDGCGVAGFYQPNSPSWVDTGVAPWDNLSLAYLYGSSKALAVAGDPHVRGHNANFPIIYRELKVNHAYLGQAHHTRMIQNYADAGPSDLRENAAEMLLGDPFMDLN